MKEAAQYDPFGRGPFPVGVRTIEARDGRRNRVFSCEIWYPAGSGTYPLIAYSHCSGGNRRSATFLCTHLSSHGYVVAALDHSETFVAELARREGLTAEQNAARIETVVGSRVPDLQFLLDLMLGRTTWNSEAKLDLNQVGVVGHSFGEWTVLSIPEIDPRIRAVVAHDTFTRRCGASMWRSGHSGLHLWTRVRILKMHDSYTSNPEIRNLRLDWTCSPFNFTFRISGFEVQESCNFKISPKRL
ncbi:MAG: hypothetical protein DMG14_19985 [Acidobacteria bacterium]|nr:MAG: hypothetical protein DMG14_19985 [Acidobacteriota bacterium]